MDKKFKKMIVISLICIFSSCIEIFTFTLKVNGEKKYKLTCNENLVEFQVKRIRGTNYRILITPKKGNFDFFPDSLTIIVPEGSDISYKKFVYDNKEITEHQVIEKGKTLTFYFYSFGRYAMYNSSPEQIELLIPPSGFIMCNGRPLVTDTIRIE